MSFKLIRYEDIINVDEIKKYNIFWYCKYIRFDFGRYIDIEGIVGKKIF